MICSRCSGLLCTCDINIVECQKCGEPMSTPTIPRYVVCDECSKKYGICEICGKPLKRGDNNDE